MSPFSPYIREMMPKVSGLGLIPHDSNFFNASTMFILIPLSIFTSRMAFKAAIPNCAS